MLIWIVRERARAHTHIHKEILIDNSIHSLPCIPTNHITKQAQGNITKANFCDDPRQNTTNYKAQPKSVFFTKTTEKTRIMSSGNTNMRIFTHKPMAVYIGLQNYNNLCTCIGAGFSFISLLLWYSTTAAAMISCIVQLI